MLLARYFAGNALRRFSGNESGDIQPTPLHWLSVRAAFSRKVQQSYSSHNDSRNHRRADERTWDEAKERQGGKTSADVGRIQKNAPVSALVRELRKACAGIRDGGELPPRGGADGS